MTPSSAPPSIWIEWLDVLSYTGRRKAWKLSHINPYILHNSGPVSSLIRLSIVFVPGIPNLGTSQESKLNPAVLYQKLVLLGFVIFNMCHVNLGRIYVIWLPKLLHKSILKEFKGNIHLRNSKS